MNIPVLVRSGILLFSALLLSRCTTSGLPEKDHAGQVNPFIGTVGPGNTFYGPSMPYGMIKPGPWTDYQDGGSRGTVFGFSHIHVSGMAGGGNHVPGEIIFMPFVDTTTVPARIVSRFQHKNEEASPAYYKVFLDDYGITAELTATLRTCMHKYTFPATDGAGIALKSGRGSLHIAKNHQEVSGHSHGIWFLARFSKPFKSYVAPADGKQAEASKTSAGKDFAGLFRFDTQKGESVFMKVGISVTDSVGARRNLEAEIPSDNYAGEFDRIRRETRDAWNKELGKIEVEGGTPDERIIFYTSLYHAMMHPNIWMDADRRYRSTNGKIYTAEGFENYTNFSLWDTFRALHPLFTIINVKRTAQFVRTFLERYDHTGRMLIMEFNNTEGTQPPMIAYHSLSVVADAYAKGIRDYDVRKAYKAMKSLANDLQRKGKSLYLDYGYIPCDLKGQSVSRTLEYSYDDWCITQMAKDFNDDSALIYFGQRGEFYKNLFDTTVHFMRGRKRNFDFVSPFDPDETISHYTEANAWQYSTFVPQDIHGLIRLMGGNRPFERWLDSCFTRKADRSRIHVRDVTGLIGQYAHGNEPSHHMAYLYDYAGSPWKTQMLVRKILTTLYANRQDGITGNEDCGQMSAWYVMSAMGFYAVTPGLPYYTIGSPLFDKVTLHLENGNRFIIRAKNNSPENVYIQSASLNGKSLSGTWLRHKDIMQGGSLVFTMSAGPNREWGTGKKDRPPFPEKKFHWLASPTPHFKDIYFLGSLPVRISSGDPGAQVYYTLDGSVPTKKSLLYSRPILIRKASVLRLTSYSDGALPAYPRRVHFYPIEKLKAVKIPRATSGLRYHFVDQPVENAARIMEYPVTQSGIIRTFNVDMVKDQRPFGCWYEGYLKAPQTGVYTFSLKVNDGAILFLNGKEIINNDGGHRSFKQDKKIFLEKGWHPVVVKYFQMGLAKELVVSWQGPGIPEQEIPAAALFHQ